MLALYSHTHLLYSITILSVPLPLPHAFHSSQFHKKDADAVISLFAAKSALAIAEDDDLVFRCADVLLRFEAT